MNITRIVIDRIMKAKASLKKYRKVVTCLAALVVFVTMYALIMPAATLDESEADKTPGIGMTHDVGSGNDSETGSGTSDSIDANSNGTDGDANANANGTDSDARSNGNDADIDVGANSNYSDNNVNANGGNDIGTDENVSDGKGTGKADSDVQKTDSAGKEKKESVITADGTKYEIEVKCGADAKVPEGARLSIKELKEPENAAGKKAEAEKVRKKGVPEYTYEEYLDMTERALGWDEGTASYVRFFDIKIVDKDGEKVDIKAPVDVKIRLMDLSKADADDGDDLTKVVHFRDGAHRGDVVKKVDINAESGNAGENNDVALSFEAESFSVYAVVDAPEPVVTGEEAVKTLKELSNHTDSTFHMSVTRDKTVNYFINTMNTNSAFHVTVSESDASDWIFVPAGGENKYYIATVADGQKKYITNPSGNLAGLSDTPDIVFVVSQAADGLFYIKIDGQDKWLQYSNGGKGIRFYNENSNNSNCRITLKYSSDITIDDDPYGLNGKSYGIAYQNNEISARGMMAATKTTQGKSGLEAETLTIRPDVLTNEGTLLVAKDSDLTEWKFASVKEDKYYISCGADGQVKYITLRDGNITLEDEPDETNSLFTVQPGTGANSGKYMFHVDGMAIDLPGGTSDVFKTSDAQGATSWMNLVEKSESLTDEDFNLYHAKKVSISDIDKVYDGQQVIVYTRIWNEKAKKYEFYAIDHDGTLIACRDTGDSIEWIGSKVNTALWNFTEYHNDDGTPNYYYELQNDQYGEYIVPQMTGNQTISDEKAGINLNGRKRGQSYSTIMSWDEDNYAFAGLKAENGRIAACKVNEANDFYFAIMRDKESEDKLTTVSTIDSDDFGISMKMVNFNNPIENGRDSGQTAFFGRDSDKKGLLSSDLKDDGFPVATDKSTSEGSSLGDMFSDVTDVNHLFLQSIYNESGYFEYDSTQNFAHLKDDGTFDVYNQIAATGNDNRVTRTHGQFMPYNEITDGNFCTITNLTDVLGNTLADTDPRKNEKLYMIDPDEADYFFGMQMDASFTQTQGGVDAWGHDIIFEFSGDDDFWFYVDGELVLDLGGVHKAMVGSINFRTGEVKSSRGNSSLYQIFKSNYQARGLSNAEISRLLNEKFVRNEAGQYVFRDYSKHDMKMFYMERGAGASNLKMRFNLASAKPGTFLLSKKLSGTEETENSLIEFPYQIWYKTEKDGEAEYHLLGEKTGNDHNVKIDGTETPLPFKSSFTPAGAEEAYQNVFMLKPGQKAVVTLPEGATTYYVKECGVDPGVYDAVKVNGSKADKTVPGNSAGSAARYDYSSKKESISDRQSVEFDNHVKEGVMRTLSLTKKLYDVNGRDLLHYPDDKTEFSFRLYLGNENDNADDLPSANMHPYHVKDADGYYCRWDTGSHGFVSIGKNEYSQLNKDEKEAATFMTSPNGAISKIPADHTVEVRSLIVGIKYKIEERDNEIPKGYTLRLEDGYTRVDEGHKGSFGTEPATGTIALDEDPEIEIRNQKGWGLTVEKNWTDKDFVNIHDPIYFAVYTKTAVAGSGSDANAYTYKLVDGSVRQLSGNKTSIYYFFDNLKSGIPFSDYEVFEVTLEGDFSVDSNGQVTGYTGIERIGQDGSLTVGADPVSGGHVPGLKYKVHYDKGEQTVHNENIRTDTVTNSRPGIRFMKTDMNGRPLGGAEFTIKDRWGRDVAAEKFESDKNGLITIACLPKGTYYLREVKTPKGYIAIPGCIEVAKDGSVTVKGPEGSFVKSIDDEFEMTVITVKNREADLKVIKTDETGSGALEGAHFALYDQVTTADGKKIRDYTPKNGFEDIVTGADGVLRGIDMQLGSGTYYLKETSAPDGYELMDEDLCFTIGKDGVVSIENAGEGSEGTAGQNSWLSKKTDSDSGKVSYTVRVPNAKTTKVSIWKTNEGYDTITTGAAFELYRADDYDDTAGAPKEGATIISSGTTGENGILYLGELAPGEYRLVETAAPTGYQKLSGAIKITVNPGDSGVAGTGAATAAAGNKVTAIQSGSAAEVVTNGNDPDKHWVAGQDDDTWQIRVWNNPGAELPSSGGPGTTWIYILGSIMTAGAGIVLITRRRMGV